MVRRSGAVVAEGVADELRAVAQTGLGEDVVDVGPRRGLGDQQGAAISVFDSPAAMWASTSARRFGLPDYLRKLELGIRSPAISGPPDSCRMHACGHPVA